MVFYACAAPVGVMCRWLGTFVQISSLVAVSFVTLVVIQLLTHSLEMYDVAQWLLTTIMPVVATS